MKWWAWLIAALVLAAVSVGLGWWLARRRRNELWLAAKIAEREARLAYERHQHKTNLQRGQETIRLEEAADWVGRAQVAAERAAAVRKELDALKSIADVSTLELAARLNKRYGR